MHFALASNMETPSTQRLLTLAIALNLAACAAAHENDSLPDAGLIDIGVTLDSSVPHDVDSGLLCALPQLAWGAPISPQVSDGDFAATLTAIGASSITVTITGDDDPTPQVYVISVSDTADIAHEALGSTVVLHVSDTGSGHWTRVAFPSGWEIGTYNEGGFVRHDHDPVPLPPGGAEMTLTAGCTRSSGSCNGASSSGTSFDLVLESGGVQHRLSPGASIANPSASCGAGSVHFISAVQLPGCSQVQPDGSMLILEAAFGFSMEYTCLTHLVAG